MAAPGVSAGLHEFRGVEAVVRVGGKEAGGEIASSGKSDHGANEIRAC